jgi:hypothetical protein
MSARRGRGMSVCPDEMRMVRLAEAAREAAREAVREAARKAAREAEFLQVS